MNKSVIEYGDDFGFENDVKIIMFFCLFMMVLKNSLRHLEMDSIRPC